MGPRATDDGECKTKISEVLMTILCYAEGDSSLKCAQLMSTLVVEIQNKRLSSALIVPVTRIWVPEGGMIAPVMENDRIWRGEVQLKTIVKEAN